MQWAVSNGVVLVLASCAPASPSFATPAPAEEPAPPPPSRAPEPSRTAPKVAEGTSARYLVDGKPVDRSTFDQIVSSTIEVPGTWYCDEVTDGGETGWDATGQDGTVYQIRLTTDAEGSTNTIRSQPSVR
jgi:hypothetical protein